MYREYSCNVANVYIELLGVFVNVRCSPFPLHPLSVSLCVSLPPSPNPSVCLCISVYLFFSLSFSLSRTCVCLYMCVCVSVFFAALLTVLSLSFCVFLHKSNFLSFHIAACLMKCLSYFHHIWRMTTNNTMLFIPSFFNISKGNNTDQRHVAILSPYCTAKTDVNYHHCVAKTWV